MAHYGWPYGRDGPSPYASQTDTHPHVTDDDFSYITSEDLEHSLQSPRAYDPRTRPPPFEQDIEDDILLIKNKGVTYPIHFPAYSIGDGKLCVGDVRDRIALVLELNDRRKDRTRMLYKGKQLKDGDAPIREYGVKNNSEILVVIPDGRASDDESSESSEEVIVADTAEAPKSKSKKRRNRKKNRSPRDSGTNLDVPQSSGAGESTRSSQEESRHPSRVPSPNVPEGPLEKLQTIGSHFNTKLLPLCLQFSAHPPKDPKKREDEHRKLSETVMQQVLLKLDEVETGGDPEIRAKRKELINQVHAVLKGIDEHMPQGAHKSH